MNMLGMRRFAGGLAVLACAAGMACGQADSAGPMRTPVFSGAAQEEPKLVIETEEPLPETYPYGQYQVRFQARGGLTPLHWRVEARLPPGIKMEDDGLLHGQAQQSGQYQFTVLVTDSGAPRQTANKVFRIRVLSEFALEWKSLARVNGNRIEGSVEVTNTTEDDLDLTYDVKAVAENGRATEIGYQHFMLRRATIKQVLPFGETLPHGAYMVYVNAVGEVAAKKQILRQRLQTAAPLQVLVGP